MRKEIILKYKQITISVLGLGDWVIQHDGSVYFSDEETGAYWESSISIFRDYTDEMLYQDFIADIQEDMDTVPAFSTFKVLIEDSFKIYEGFEL